MSEISPTARAPRTVEILQNRPGATADELAERLGVTERAAHRYVAVLRGGRHPGGPGPQPAARGMIADELEAWWRPCRRLVRRSAAGNPSASNGSSYSVGEQSVNQLPAISTATKKS